MVYLPFLSGIQRINKSFKRFSKFITCQFYFEAQAVWVHLQHCGNSKGNQPCAQRLYPVPFWESIWHEDPDQREHLDQLLPWGKLIQENFAWQNEAPDSESGASCLSENVLSLGGYGYCFNGRSIPYGMKFEKEPLRFCCSTALIIRPFPPEGS